MGSLVKYLRGGAAAGNQRAPTIAASVCEDVEDDASFFDLELAVPGDGSAEEERVEFNLAVASGDEAAPEDSKTDGDSEEEEEADAAAQRVLRPAATKFRVLLLKLMRPKPGAVPGEKGGSNSSQVAKQAGNNRFLIKFRVDEAPPVFARDSSSRASEEEEERRFANKEVLLKYLNKIKPLYVKVSRRFPGGGGEGDETDAEPDAASSCQPATPQPVVVACGVRAPRASVPAGLKQACKRLGKSLSAAPSSPSSTTPAPQRRDDSLLQVQDGIQSAIAHCKRSLTASSSTGTRATARLYYMARLDLVHA
jgi:hypothetical protein